MSATFDEELFERYYTGACFVKITGRRFPIEDEYASEDPENYVDAAIRKTIEIHESEQNGDILVFLTGLKEINRAIREVQAKMTSSKPAVVLPLHGRMGEDETKELFKSTDLGTRKIIFATSVAETSITIDGICHVIDSGMSRESMWDSKRNMHASKIGYTTQSAIKQRRGRAGRTAPGKVCRNELVLRNLSIQLYQSLIFLNFSSVIICTHSTLTSLWIFILEQKFSVFNPVLPCSD